MKLYYISIFCVIINGGCITSNEKMKEEASGIDWLEKSSFKYSFASHVRSLPLVFRYKELAKRNWTNSSGERIELLGVKFFKLSTKGFPNILMLKYGDLKSKKTDCIDFYATSAESEDYAKKDLLHLICHDLDCPSIKTKVTLEENDERVHFRIDGNFIDQKTKKLKHSMYSLELNPKWQMIRGFSHFISDVKKN
jgi:hypothetical protein